jgi:hypothetical protein
MGSIRRVQFQSNSVGVVSCAKQALNVPAGTTGSNVPAGTFALMFHVEH